MLWAADYEAYLPIVRALFLNEEENHPDERERALCFNWNEILPHLCRLHATVRAHQGEVDPYVTTLHHQ